MRLLRFQIRATVKFSSGLDYLVSSGTAGRGVHSFGEFLNCLFLFYPNYILTFFVLSDVILFLNAYFVMIKTF